MVDALTDEFHSETEEAQVSAVSEHAQVSAVSEEAQVSAVSWAAIVAGGVASAALTLVLLAFGAGMSLSALAATGTITGDEFRQTVAVSGGNIADFEARICAFEGSSAFMRFLDVDHSAWMKILGIPGRGRLYILGNPLIARPRSGGITRSRVGE